MGVDVGGREGVGEGGEGGRGGLVRGYEGRDEDIGYGSCAAEYDAYIRNSKQPMRQEIFPFHLQAQKERNEKKAKERRERKHTILG